MFDPMSEVRYEDRGDLEPGDRTPDGKVILCEDGRRGPGRTDEHGNLIYDPAKQLPIYDENGIVYMTIWVGDTTGYVSKLGLHGLPVQWCRYDMVHVMPTRDNAWNSMAVSIGDSGKK